MNKEQERQITTVNSVGVTVLKTPVQCKRCGEFDYSPCDGDCNSLPDKIKALEDRIESLQRERDNPQPLTLKELSGMEGKPVYNINNNAWCVIDYIDEIDELCTIIHFTDSTELDFEQDYLCLYATEPKGDKSK